MCYDSRFHTDKWLEDDVLNLLFNLTNFLLLFLQVLQKCSLTPLVAWIVFIFIFIFFKVIVVFVDRVVSEMNKYIPSFGRVFLFFTSKPCQPFILQLYSKWVVWCDDDLQSDVEFEVIDQHGIVNLIGHYQVRWHF